MNVTFRQLRVFLAVAEQGSVTAAARVCHVTQPTVSMLLKELSESAGLPLYEQIGKRLHLTQAGETLAKTARAMVDEWAAFEQQIDAFKGLTRGRLRLAVVSTAKYFVPDLLGQFCAQYPDADISLEVLNRDGVLERLMDNRDDLYIMSQPPDQLPLIRHEFLPNRLVLIAPRSHRLAGQPRLEVKMLGDERFIARERGSGTRMASDAWFASKGFHPLIRLELGSNEAVKRSVAAGMGLAVVSEHALSQHHPLEDVVVLDVDGFPIKSSWWTLYPAGKRLSPLASVFLEHIDAMAQRWYKNRP